VVLGCATRRHFSFWFPCFDRHSSCITLFAIQALNADECAGLGMLACHDGGDMTGMDN
jgi:hypothetical protein